jgi:hypothetical protein
MRLIKLLWGKLHFENIAFTAMLRGKKHMKLDNKTNYFDYFQEKVLVAPGETMVIDFPEADEHSYTMYFFKS